MKNHLANIITSLRIIGSMALLFFFFPSLPFYIIYLICGLTDSVRDLLRRIFPDRHVHEFRYTFITRAKECGVNPEVVMIWSGHEFDNDVKTSRVDRGYTTYLDEYLFRETSKVRYEL